MNFLLPKFAFIMASNHEDDVLDERHVIVHIPSLSIIEAIQSYRIDEVPFTTLTSNVSYTSHMGITEHFTLFIHRSGIIAPDQAIVTPVEQMLIECGKWLKEHFAWQDDDLKNKRISESN